MEMTAYKQGQFSWIDMMAKDVDQAKTFYTALFGWDAEDQFDGEQRIYTMFRLRGKDVAGLGGMMPDMKKAGMPSVWNSYVNVTSVDDVLEKVAAAGGKSPMPAMDVMDAGRMAMVQDPSGAMVSLWQPNKHMGAQLCNEPGAFMWNELMTPDIDAAKKFYGAALGWTFKQDLQGGMPYEMIRNDGAPNGGMMKLEGEQLKNVPPNWTVYFCVADLDATCAKIKTLGGDIHVPPMDAGPGTMAVVQDDQGTWFNVLQFKN